MTTSDNVAPQHPFRILRGGDTHPQTITYATKADRDLAAHRYANMDGARVLTERWSPSHLQDGINPVWTCDGTVDPDGDAMNDTPDGSRGSTILTVDVTDPRSVDAFVAQLDRYARSELQDALRDADSVDAHTRLLQVIRDTLARKAPGRTVVGVVFETAQFGDKFYLHDTGTVLYEDGATDEIGFDGQAENLLTPEYGNHGPEFTLAVDLRNDEFDTDDDFSGTIHSRFDVPEPVDPDSGDH